MMTQDERELLCDAIVAQHLNGRDIRDCLAIITDVMSRLITHTSPNENQQLKCAIILQNYANAMVDMLLGDFKGTA